MKFYSTKPGNKNSNSLYSFEQSIFMGPAPDGGLFMPITVPVLPESFYRGIKTFTLSELGMHTISPFVDLSNEELMRITTNAFSFPAPLNTLSDDFKILELFHGPTLAFKDFGARFMAQTMKHYRPKDTHINILVATSGDTGGAVASAFSGLDGFNVFILFPKGKVSPLQRMQLTTWDDNVQAIEVNGTFDDCQRLVKMAFADIPLRSNKVFGSANSINISRLLPQMVYYFDAFRQVEDIHNLTVIVPSGNFGNLTAGLFAKRMGLPISKFIAATNINDVIPQYLNTGNYCPTVSRETFSNAMDVGDPSNFVRMLDLYGGSSESSTWNNLKQDVSEHVVDDKSTLDNIRDVYEKYGYIMDPHTAVAYDASKAYPGNNIIVSTAHWSKFAGTIERAIGTLPELPKSLQDLLIKQERMIPIQAEYGELVSIINR